MSDVVLVAIITSVCTALPLVLAQIVNYIKTIHAIKESVRLKQSEIDLVATGAFRNGHVAGAEYVRRESQPAPLGDK